MIRKILLLLFLTVSVHAETVTVAVASNFSETAREVGRAFESHTDHDVRIVPGSSGKLYAQIVNGAPFDVFLSADALRPKRLEAGGFASRENRRPYAIGRLVVWSRDPELDGADCLALLASPGEDRVAIANPLFAPYGFAAKEYLQRMGWWDDLVPNLVMGENISQALQFAARGGARVGLVALSQVAGLENTSCLEYLPAASHAPIEQQVVLLDRSTGNPAALAFMQFLRAAEATTIIEAAGYGLPGDSP